MSVKSLPFCNSSHLNQCLLLLCLILILQSCKSSTFYTPVRQNQDMAYQPKPNHFDSLKTNYYLSGNFYNNRASNLKDQLSMVELNLAKGHLLSDRFNLAYGVFGFWGKYQNKSLTTDEDYYFNNKRFNGYGFRTSINYIMAPTEQSALRFPGFELSYSQENGAFASYRKTMLKQPYYYTNSNTKLLTLGYSFEYIWQHGRINHLNFSFRYFKGITTGNSEFHADSYYLKTSILNKNYNLSFLINYKQFSLLTDLNKLGPKFGLIYSVKYNDKKLLNNVKNEY